MIEIELGNGDKIVSDIYDDVNGDWSGIAISDGDCEVGEYFNTDAKTVDELNPIIVIRTRNVKSLDVIIQSCERAKSRLI